jgi:protein-tyrosine phosphatase
MSYSDLDTIRAEGIDAIVNLCAEFCDLHEIQEKTGFEVYYLPIPDECAPDMAEMEKALDWFDEAVKLGKRVLVHCRFGIGRTGTFVTAYLLRKGAGLREASRTLKSTQASPSSHSQMRFLRKYSKRFRERGHS